MPTRYSEQPELLRDGARESIEKAHDLLDEMRVVQEYENAILSDEKPLPLSQPEDSKKPSNHRDPLSSAPL